MSFQVDLEKSQDNVLNVHSVYRSLLSSPDSRQLGGVTGGPFRFPKTGFCSEIMRAHVSGPILFEYQKTFGVLK